MYRFLVEGGLQKADCVMAGDFVNSTDRYTKTYQWPHLELQEWSAPMEGPNQVKPVGTFVLKKPDTTVTSAAGMPFAGIMRIRRITTQSVVAF
jgi:hypothetical protein